MLPTNREFDFESFKQNDQLGRYCVKQFFKTRGIEAKDNPDRMGVDLKITGKSSASGRVYKNFGVEVARSPYWNGGLWPFESVNIPLRKEKFFSSRCLYALVNRSGDRIMLIDSNKILGSIVREIPTKAKPAGELFYDIPLERFKAYENRWN